MDKAKLRTKLKEARLLLKTADRTLKSREISRRFEKLLDWSQVKTVHYFESLQYLHEVDIGDFIVWLEDEHPDITLFTPKKIGDEWEMVSIKDKSAPEQFDVIIVPMLGFDKELNRIGYGGGYYDKFLSTQPASQKIGVCFEEGRLENIPTESHDIPLDVVVTEAQTYTVSNG